MTENVALKNTNHPVEDAIRGRSSIRAYLDRPVDRAEIERILETASYAPSGSNFQPWQVHVLTGSSLERFGNAVRDAFLRDEPDHLRDYTYYPTGHFEPYRSRRRECGLGLYSALGIARGEDARMKQQRSRNYIFFGAPCALVFTIDARLETGSFLDYGFFIQSVMLAARERGIDSCTQASIGEYPDIVRRELRLGEDRRVVAGMALGYGDVSAAENSFRPSRAPVSEFATFLD